MSGDHGVAGGSHSSVGGPPSPSSSSSCQQVIETSPSPARPHSRPHSHPRHHPEAGELPSVVPAYRLAGMQHDPEDILICVDADEQLDLDMKISGSKGHSLSRLDAIKQAIFLFVHAKLSMHSLHRFAFAALSHSASWLQQNFTSDIEVINSTVRTLRSSGSFSECDLSLLFQMAAALARKSQARGRILRVILIYCRSDVVPAYPKELSHSQASFTFDALYLHDKPSQENCPQRVYDALVEALEKVSEVDGYIYESSWGLTRILFRLMCCLLAHPQQRCGQDDFEVPKDISRVVVGADGATSAAVMRKEDDGGASKSFV